MIRTMPMAPVACVAFMALVAAWNAGCTEPIEVSNLAPRVRHNSLDVADGAPVDVYYTVEDAEGDDVDITIEVCTGPTSCTSMTESPGGDGTSNLPTRRRERVLHHFIWNAACDIGPEEAVFIRITPQDTGLGAPADSDTFSLSEIGYSGACGL